MKGLLCASPLSKLLYRLSSFLQNKPVRGVFFFCIYHWENRCPLNLSNAVQSGKYWAQGLQLAAECLFRCISTSGCSLSVPGPRSRRVSVGLTSAHFSSVSSSTLWEESSYGPMFLKVWSTVHQYQSHGGKMDVLRKNSDSRAPARLIESNYRERGGDKVQEYAF